MRLLTVAIVPAIFICFVACGRQAERVDPHQAALELPVPAGVNPQLWQTLRQALADELERLEHSRGASVAPMTQLSKVPDFQLADFSTSSFVFSWSFRSQGDYDQNGEVNVSDLSPIGAYFEKTRSDLEWPKAQLADGDNNGVVTIADITPLALTLGTQVTGYLLQTTATPESAGTWTTEAQVPLGAATLPLSGGYKQFNLVLDSPLWGNAYRVVPFQEVSGHPNEVGIPSDFVLAPDPTKATFGPWEQHSLGTLGDSTAFYDMAASAWEGRPAVVWYNSETDVISAAVASSTNPETQTDWDVDVLISDRFGTSWGVDLAECGGALCAVFTNLDGNIYCARYAAGEWIAHNVTLATAGGFYYYPVIAEVAGRPAVLLAGIATMGAERKIYYAYPATPVPTLQSDWTVTECFTEDDGFTADVFPERPLAMTEAAGVAVVAFQVSQAGDRKQMLGRAKLANPQGSSDWVNYELGGENGYADLETGFDGQPQFVNASREFYVTDYAQHSDPADWSFTVPIQEYSGPQQTQLEVITGLPTFAWWDPTGLRISQGRVQRPASDQWFLQELTGELVGSTPMRLLQVAGRPALFVTNGNSLDYCQPQP